MHTPAYGQAPRRTAEEQDSDRTVERTVRILALFFGGAMAAFMLWMAWANGG